jgi:hypothetical protein
MFTHLQLSLRLLPLVSFLHLGALSFQQRTCPPLRRIRVALALFERRASMAFFAPSPLQAQPGLLWSIRYDLVSVLRRPVLFEAT